MKLLLRVTFFQTKFKSTSNNLIAYFSGREELIIAAFTFSKHAIWTKMHREALKSQGKPFCTYINDLDSISLDVGLIHLFDINAIKVSRSAFYGHNDANLISATWI